MYDPNDSVETKIIDFAYRRKKIKGDKEAPVGDVKEFSLCYMNGISEKELNNAFTQIKRDLIVDLMSDNEFKG